MSETVREELNDLLSQHGQQHVLRWWDELDSAQQQTLAQQIRAVDFDAIESTLRRLNEPTADASTNDDIQPAMQVMRLPKRADEQEAWAAARQAGQQALDAGKVGAILVAGGQGTRLGFHLPKGMLPIGPVTDATLFQILVEQLLERSRRAGKTIPFYVMTSDATHGDTVDFFKKHSHFGLPADSVFFFQQGRMPAVDKQNGKLLLAAKDSLALSPDGHGGMLEALERSGCLADMRRRGIEYLYYHQVDNPTAIVCDPVFIGFHILRQSELSTKVVAKRDAEERMGVICATGGKTRIVEYINMPREVAHQVDKNGELVHWAGNTATHVFSRELFDRLIRENIQLPLYASRKKVPYIDDAGNEVAPSEENGIKFERFIFDVLPHARNALVVEADRAREFNPVKNAEGNDSPASARAALTAIHGSWLRSAGANVPEGASVEISPLFALDEVDVKQKISAGQQFDGPVVLK